MCDKLVYDLSQEVEGTPNIFIRKDWLSILDNMNGNYGSNQTVIDTSQLSNSNKWMAYREGYLAVPMLLTLKGSANATGAVAINDYALGLKNWFGTVIHSLTLDYNGTTIIQQTPFINMWNIFKLLTTLSYNDVLTQGSTIGFYPDNVDSFIWTDASAAGVNLCNNKIVYTVDIGSGNVSNKGSTGNFGLTQRCTWINYDGALNDNAPFLPIGNAKTAWVSQISKNPHSTALANTNPLVQQVSVMGIIHLKHLASFFNMCPLLKGVFMKLTINLNNATSTITTGGAATTKTVASYTSNVAVGGTNPLLIPTLDSGSSWIRTTTVPDNIVITYNLSVGNVCLDNSITGVDKGSVANNIYLYVPAYSFNPNFEKAYMASSPKMIKYTDVYQYQIKGIAAGGQITSLITNGLANVKSVLIIPFLAKNKAGTAYEQYRSPFDTAGAGTTAPLVSLTNFNIKVSGQNAIYNSQKYNFEEFNNQLYGENAVNGGLTDGLTSGLIDYYGFSKSQCYYYVNVERMLPVEKNVPKSIWVEGTNNSAADLDFIVFVEYEASIKIDLLTGARVA